MDTNDFMEICKRKEELHPDLAKYLGETSIGLSLRHPLVYNILHTPQMNAYCNAQYRAKKEYIKKLIADKKYSHVIWMYERPYRMEKFAEIKSLLTNKEYWELLGSIWSDSENLWQYGPMLDRLINSFRPGREAMMGDDEKEFLANLPDELVVYRGHQMVNRRGYSWTMSYWRAKWFAERFQQARTGVLAGSVKKSDIIAVLLGRNEYEVICNPQNVREIHTVSKQKRRVWVNNVFRKTKSAFVLRSSVHGPWHWEKVEKNGLALAKLTPKCDNLVVQLFALIHDCCRVNDDHDPDHGGRAADFARQLYEEKALEISPKQLELLAEACIGHNNGETSTDPTIGVCWDADRLDLTRVGISPDPKLLSTSAGKQLLWKL